MIKLGLLTAILPELSFREVVDYAASIGLENLEVCCWPKEKASRRYAGVTHLDVDALSIEELLAEKSYADSKGLTISALAYYPNPLSSDKEEAEKAIKHINKLIDASAAMDINMVSTFIGKDKTKTIEENIELMKVTWTPILKHAEEKNVKIVIENCHMLYTKNEWPGGNNLACSPYVWREMFNLSKNIGLNYDPSHPVVLGMDIASHIKEFASRIFHVHFKDVRIERDMVTEYGYFDLPSKWHTPKLPGMGEVDFGSFISSLNQYGFDGYGSIEIEDRAFEGDLAKTKKGIEQSARYLRQYL